MDPSFLSDEFILGLPGSPILWFPSHLYQAVSPWDSPPLSDLHTAKFTPSPLLSSGGYQQNFGIKCQLWASLVARQYRICVDSV